MSLIPLSNLIELNACIAPHFIIDLVLIIKSQSAEFYDQIQSGGIVFRHPRGEMLAALMDDDPFTAAAQRLCL